MIRVYKQKYPNNLKPLVQALGRAGYRLLASKFQHVMAEESTETDEDPAPRQLPKRSQGHLSQATAVLVARDKLGDRQEPDTDPLSDPHPEEVQENPLDPPESRQEADDAPDASPREEAAKGEEDQMEQEKQTYRRLMSLAISDPDLQLLDTLDLVPGLEVEEIITADDKTRVKNEQQLIERQLVSGV